MSDNRGISPKAVSRNGGQYGTLPFVLKASGVSGSTTAYFNNGNPAQFSFRVILAWGIMTGGGGAGDTAVIQKTRGATTTAITNTADLSAFSDTDQFDFSQINDANYEVLTGDTLKLTTASNALCDVYALCVRV